MSSSLDLAREYTGLDLGARQHLSRLMSTWSLLADLSFADLLLYAPFDEYSLAVAAHSAATSAPSGSVGQEPAVGVAVRGLHFVVLGQMRPTTSQTLFENDLVGQIVAASDVPLVMETWRQGMVLVGERPLDHQSGGEAVTARYQCIPVRWKGEVVGVLSRVWSPTAGRRTGGLERTYVRLFERLATMVNAGIFPFVTEEAVEESPRVGDGVIVLDAERRISFASPNAVNALHRTGIMTAIVGSTLGELGVESEAVTIAFEHRIPSTEEIERRPDVIVLVRAIPLIDEGEVTGAAVLVRDVTDLRRRDRLLLSKDAAIREVHHRVKNNLQTISSLLRLQSRRISDPGARAPLLEAERRVQAIAKVHEILARDPGEQVPFDELVPTLLQLSRDANVSRGDVAVELSGDAGELPADVATPLAVVLTELLQNATKHAFGPSSVAEPTDTVEASDLERPTIGLAFEVRGRRLEIVVRDNGSGFPPGFDLDRTRSLGLSIVRDLVRSQLAGSISVENDGGATIRLSIPIDGPGGS